MAMNMHVRVLVQALISMNAYIYGVRFIAIRQQLVFQDG